jgi:uncharacterized repeat protein (TIGR04076 family)
MVKITVIRSLYNPELGEKYRRPDIHKGPCPYEEGQEFQVENAVQVPDGLCPWAWHDMYKFVLALMSGAEFAGMKQSNTILVNCTDGIKPVVFKLERVDD